MNQHSAREKQARFLKKIEDILPKSTTLVNELADVLQISTDSAYRRMRGETYLGIDEILQLCDYFKVSFDTFNSSDEGTVTFRYSKMESSRVNFVQYFSRMLSDLELINKADERHITYACEDIPIFHHFRHPVLANFKMYYWMHAILNVPELENEKFSATTPDEELTNIGNRIIELYARIPSTEIWTETTIQSTVKQIEFFWDAGKFNSREDALAVCSSLKDEISFLQKQAEKSSKMLSEIGESINQTALYQLYFSEIEVTNNCVLVDLGSLKSVYLGHLTFSTMSTISDAYCIETMRWLDIIRKKSVLISGVSEKQRYQVFKKYFKQIDELYAKISENI